MKIFLINVLFLAKLNAHNCLQVPCLAHFAAQTPVAVGVFCSRFRTTVTLPNSFLVAFKNKRAVYTLQSTEGLESVRPKMSTNHRQKVFCWKASQIWNRLLLDSADFLL